MSEPKSCAEDIYSEEAVTLLTMSISSTRSLLLNTILIQKEPKLLGEMANSRTGAWEGQMRLEHFAVPESKEVLGEG